MPLTTVIFDMDGLLIDSEPLWNEAAKEVFADYSISLSPAQYASTTGLRTREFLDHWFAHFTIDKKHLDDAEKAIVNRVIEKVKTKGQPMPGVGHIVNFFTERNFKIGLATSSPQTLIDVVLEILGIKDRFAAITTAEPLPNGKPHPQVYLNCAALLEAAPANCLCFEDSINGMIAAKAARMKCVVVPAAHQLTEARWALADLKITSLLNFNDLLLAGL